MKIVKIEKDADIDYESIGRKYLVKVGDRIELVSPFYDEFKDGCWSPTTYSFSDFDEIYMVLGE